MINKRFDHIDKTDIDALISNEEPESRNLDYKQELPGGKDDDKKEFLADVSSFANAAGGYILYGISEKRDGESRPTGIPDIAEGLSINADAEIKRLESLIRDGIEPRLTGCHIREIPGFAKGPVILVYIPKSWMPPHMVTIKGSSRFFIRKGKIKYPMDIIEIRSAVLFSESLTDKVRQFRDNRLAKIIADETPVPLYQSAKIVMHILPISGLDVTKQVNMQTVPLAKLFPIGEQGYNRHRINFDGWLTFSSPGGAPYDSYFQLFRNGAVETVNSWWLREDMRGGKKIPIGEIEEELISDLDNYLGLERELGFEPPIFVMISLIGVKGYTMILNTRMPVFRKDEIDRDLLILPDILIENYDSDSARLLHPAFNAVYQSTGIIGSPYYDEEGNRKEG